MGYHKINSLKIISWDPFDVLLLTILFIYFISVSGIRHRYHMFWEENVL